MQFSVVKQFRNSLLRYAPTYATKLSVTELYAHMQLKLFSFKMDFNELVVVCALELRRREKIQRKNKYWVHPITSQRLVKGQFHKLYEDLRAYPEKCFIYYRMSVTSFDELLDLIRPYITYQDTKWRKAITPTERLSITYFKFKIGLNMQLFIISLTSVCKYFK
jgi:hypothetical protein